jgi:hypothetical protein
VKVVADGPLTAVTVTAFVVERPGCSVHDVARHFGCDEGAAWLRLCDAEVAGWIRGQVDDDGTWLFAVPDAA